MGKSSEKTRLRGKKSDGIGITRKEKRGRPKQRWLDCAADDMLKHWSCGRQCAWQKTLEEDGDYCSGPTWKCEQLGEEEDLM